MIRSALFIPANNPGMMQNADLFAADAIIFDLEDAVLAEEKDSARALLSHYLQTFTLKAKVIVRINSNPLWFAKDLEAIVCNRLDAILLPKANYEDLSQTKMMLTRLEKDYKISKKIAIIPLIETAMAVLDIERLINRARVSGVLLGAEDLTADIGINRTKQGKEILYARMRLALVASAYRIFSIDTPFTDINDNEGLIEDATFARDLGFSAKAAIHPRQIPIINKVFSPTEEEIIWAKRVIEKSKVASGAFSLDGKMVDQPIIERAKKTIQDAKRYDLV